MKRYLKIPLLCVLLFAGFKDWAQCPQNFVHIVGRQNPLCDTSLLDWATWSTVTPTGGTAVLSSNLTVTVTKPSGGLSTTPGIFNPTVFPTQYNVPVNNTALRNDLAGLFTFCFSSPVINPQICLSSIGNGNTSVPVITSAPYNVIWAGPGMTYPNDTTFVGTEGYTIIEFIGTFTCLTFNYLQSETYCNVTFGIIDTNCQSYTIPPVCPGNPDTLRATGAISYTWTPAYGLNTTTGSMVIANPLVSTKYFATGTDANNCVATDSFTVNVLSAYNDTVTQSICQGNTYSFNGSQYSQTGNYSFFYQTVNGCDSEVTLHLTVDSVYNSTTLATICQGGSYNFQGNTYTTAGIYPFNYTTIYGCDSDYTLQLTVNPTYYDTIPATICQGASYTFAGHTYTTAGTYNINYLTVRGCDSIVTIVLTVNPVYSDTITQSICAGGSYTYNGNNYTQAGYYPNTFQTVNGCDSVVTLNLMVNPVYYDTTVAAICTGASYNFQGTAYNATGVYPVSYTTVNGCDSVLTLVLTVNPNYYDTLNETICQGGNYTFAGHAYTVTGSYNVNYQTINGCDSDYTINLTVNPTYYDTTTQNICAGNSYTFLGNSYTQTGYYSTPYQTVEGCDSVITLHLIVNPVYYDTTVISICANENYAFEGSTYTTAGVYTASYTSVSGCDSDLTLVLTVNPTYSDTVSAAICNGQTYTLPGGTPVTAGGTYNSVLNTMRGCDSVIVTQLDVYPTYHQNRTDTICAEQKFVLPDGSTVTGGGVYVTKLSTVNSCDSSITTELFVQSEPAWFQAFITPAADTVALGKTVTLTAGSNQSGPLTYAWTPTYGLSCSDCATPLFTGNITTAYTVAVTDTNGCFGTAGVSVNVIPDYQVFVPNVFTPNGDGHNDQWQIFGNKTAMKLVQVMLFDRIGEKVFESNDINFIWDGTYRGKPAPAGVYSYIITIVWLNNVTVEPYKGTVTLLR